MPIEIGLATENELAEVLGPVARRRRARDVLGPWWPLAVRGIPEAVGALPITEAVVILGRSQARRMLLCTAPITVLDPGRRRAATTAGTIYALAAPAPGQPPPTALRSLWRHLCS